MHVCAPGGKKYPFFGKSGMLCFLETCFEIRLFTLLRTNFPSYKNKTKKKQSFDLLTDRLPISFLILSEVKQINKLLFQLKLSENLQFSDDSRGDRS